MLLFGQKQISGILFSSKAVKPKSHLTRSQRAAVFNVVESKACGGNFGSPWKHRQKS